MSFFISRPPILTCAIFTLSSKTLRQWSRNYAKALELLYPLLEEEQKLRDDFFAAYTMHMIAVIESRQGNTQNAINWCRQSLATLPAGNPSSENVLATIYSTLGKSYEQLNLPDSYVLDNSKAIALFRSANDVYNLAISLQYQARIFINQKNKAEAGNVFVSGQLRRNEVCGAEDT